MERKLAFSLSPQDEETYVIGDCRAMPELPDGSIQLILTFPPCFERMGGTDSDSFRELENYLQGLNQAFSECHRVLSPGRFIGLNLSGSCFDPFQMPSHLFSSLQRAGFHFYDDIIWSHPADAITQTLVFSKGAPRPVEECRMDEEGEAAPIRGGLVRYPNEPDFAYGSPLETLITRFSSPGELVLDPFSGNGPIPSLAALLGRRSIGYENDPSIMRILRPKAGKTGNRPKVVFQSERRLT